MTLTILYRAILVSQGGTETAALSTDLETAAATAQARIHDTIAKHVETTCRRDPTSCLSDAARLMALVTSGDDLIAPRQHRHGAIAAPTR